MSQPPVPNVPHSLMHTHTGTHHATAPDTHWATEGFISHHPQHSPGAGCLSLQTQCSQGGQGCPIYCVLFPKTPREKQQQKDHHDHEQHVWIVYNILDFHWKQAVKIQWESDTSLCLSLGLGSATMHLPCHWHCEWCVIVIVVQPGIRPSFTLPSPGQTTWLHTASNIWNSCILTVYQKQKQRVSTIKQSQEKLRRELCLPYLKNNKTSSANNRSLPLCPCTANGCLKASQCCLQLHSPAVTAQWVWPLQTNCMAIYAIHTLNPQVLLQVFQHLASCVRNQSLYNV